MQTSKTFSTQFSNSKPWKPDRTMLVVYVIFGLSLCVFGASIWFSSYPKNLYIQRKPYFEDKQEKIQNEIQVLLLEESSLTEVERIRIISKELGFVESSDNWIELKDR